jgi:hypothetical protein
MSNLQNNIENIQAEKARKKEWGEKSWIKRREKLKADKKGPGGNIFNPKKYQCWMFPAWKPETE